MSIDRIGGPSQPAPVGATDGARSVDAATTDAATEAAAPSPAEQVRAGTMSVDAYVELRVGDATKHLEGLVSPGDLGQIQQTLRSELMSDPALRGLAEAAIGRPLDEP